MIVVAITGWVVVKGISGGIEKFNRILIPSRMVILIVLSACAAFVLRLDADEGVAVGVLDAELQLLVEGVEEGVPGQGRALDADRELAYALERAQVALARIDRERPRLVVLANSTNALRATPESVAPDRWLAGLDRTLDRLASVPRITVLADTALRAKDIDEAAALQAKQRAEEALRDRGDKVDTAKALAELAMAAAQLKALEKLRKIKQ